MEHIVLTVEENLAQIRKSNWPGTLPASMAVGCVGGLPLFDSLKMPRKKLLPLRTSSQSPQCQCSSHTLSPLPWSTAVLC